MVITLIEQSIGKASLSGQSPLTYKCTSPNINIEASHPAKIRRSGFTVHNPNEKTYDNTIRQSVIGYTDHVMWPTIARSEERRVGKEGRSGACSVDGRK